MAVGSVKVRPPSSCSKRHNTLDQPQGTLGVEEERGSNSGSGAGGWQGQLPGAPGLFEPHRMLVAPQSELSMPGWQQSFRNVAGLHTVVLLYPLSLRGSLHSHRRAGGGSAFFAPAATVHHHPAALPRWTHWATHALPAHLGSLQLQQAAAARSLVTADTFQQRHCCEGQHAISERCRGQIAVGKLGAKRPPDQEM